MSTKEVEVALKKVKESFAKKPPDEFDIKMPEKEFINEDKPQNGKSLSVPNKVENSSLKDFENKLPVTICIMFYDGDVNLVPNCIRSLPQGAEVILMRNIEVEKTQEDEITEGKQYIIDNKLIKQFEYRYNKDKFSFSNFRNAMIDKATCEWIFSIDADERIANEYDFDWENFFETMPENVGGINVYIHSYNKQMNHGRGGARTQPCIRIFRRHENINYIFRAHEQIGQSISKMRYDIINAPILLNHDGYSGEDIVALADKYTRNVKLMLKDVDGPYPMNNYLLGLIKTHLISIDKLKEIMKNGNNNQE